MVPKFGERQGWFRLAGGACIVVGLSLCQTGMPEAQTVPEVQLPISTSQGAPQGHPIVRGPVAPGVQPNDLRNLPTSEAWKPGDPVRNMPDLKESPKRD